MKQKFFLTLLLLLAATTATARAYEIMVDGIYYIINGNEASVDYNPDGYSGEITIPEVVTYRGVSYPVTSIGPLAFNECRELTKVSIPNSVTSFKESAFMHCKGLKDLTISSNVTFIGDHALAYCTGLTSIVVPNSVTFIGRSAFVGCTSVTSMTVESGNPMYDSRDNCNAIIETASNTLISACKTAFIPTSVTSIGDYAFANCRGLTSLTIPNSVTHIGDEAFFYCYRLTSLTIPSSVTSLGVNPFLDCDGLKTIIVEAGNPSYDSRDSCNAIIETVSNTLISACYNTIIPSSVTSIGEWAFGRLNQLVSITIPSSITSIGDNAFYGCDYLKNVYSYIADPSRVPIGNGAFYTFDHYSNRTLHVPAGTSALYQANDSWSPFFGQIVEMSEPVSEVNCDLNGDGVVNISDVNIVVNYILTHE